MTRRIKRQLLRFWEQLPVWLDWLRAAIKALLTKIGVFVLVELFLLGCKGKNHDA